MLLAAALAVALAGAPPDSPAAPFTWPMPDPVESIPLAGVSEANGVPVRLHVLRSKRPARELLQIYATAFERAGFYIDPKQKRRLAQPHLTALDVRALVSHSVVLQPNEDGTTTCVLGEANLGAAQRAAQGQRGPAVLAGATAVMAVQQEGARYLSYQLAARPEQVREQLRAALGKEGWLPSPRPEEDGVFTRAQKVLRVLVRESEPGHSAVVVVEHG